MNPPQTPDRIETSLARIFAICNANRAALLKSREDLKLSRRRYWWQDEPQTEQTHDENQMLKTPSMGKI